jgi:c-di-GMP-binding flagellar brake protein YcgR
MYLSAIEVFMVGHKIILALQDAKFPLRFHPWVRKCDQHHLALELPDQWWRVATFLPEMRVELSTVREDSIYGLKGKVLEVSQHPPGLLVEHQNQLERIQRRTFYRLEHRAPVVISQVILPEGNILGPMPATLFDISAGGLGLKTVRFLPPETILKIDKLMDVFAAQRPDDPLILKVRWCRAGRPDGYRIGARFEFTDAKEYDRMARMINHLQVMRLSRYQHIAGQQK